MTQDEYTILAGKVANGDATDSEIGLYNAYYNAYQQKYAAWEELTEEQRESMLTSAKTEIDSYLLSDPKAKNTRLWPKIALAAAAAAAIIFGAWFYASRHLEGSVATRDLLVNDIGPGRSGATLTLADGQVIQLSDAKSGVVVGAELTYADGSDVGYSFIPKSKERRDGAEELGEKVNVIVQNLTASTAKGQTYHVTLPDGTRVWLNADSKISFPSQFNGTERKVLLTGEAYFAVKHDAKQPFRVESHGQVVEDIGTEFNINAYTDEKNIRTTLIEGSARVFAVPHADKFSHAPKDMSYGREEGVENNVFLIPNQQAVLRGMKLDVTPVDVSQVVAWKEGLFAYNNTTLEEVMRQAARWYDVTIVYEEEALKQKKLSGTVTRYDNLSGLLKAISYTTNVNFKIEGHQLLIKK